MLLRCLNNSSPAAVLASAATLCWIAFAQLIFWADQASAAQPGPDVQCDRYAARKLGVATAAPGVSFEQLNAKMAVPACEAAVARDPTNGRLLYQLGRAYEKAGKIDDALDRYGQAGAANYAPAYGSIGYIYSIGRGVEKSDRTAFEWFRNGAEAGDPASQFTLGQIYENGRGVPQDYWEALRWFRKAADQGLAEGQDSVGYFYSAGLGVAKNDAEAVIWMRKAAEQGMANSQYNLGLMYEAGRGVATDRSQALSWYQRSASGGNESAKQAVAQLEQMTSNSSIREREPAVLPNTESRISGQRIFARGVGVVPGAIVCPDFQTVRILFSQYNRHWEESSQDKLTHGQARLLRGAAAAAPDFESYGCALLPTGTPMLLETNGPIPIVSAQVPGKRSIRGVTLPLMAGGGNTPGFFGTRR